MVTPEPPPQPLREDSRAEGRESPGPPGGIGDPQTRQVSGDTWHFSGQRYEALLASTKDYVFEVTLHSGQPVATRHGCGCEAVTGFTSQEFNADASLWYRMIHVDDRPAVLEQVARLFRGEVPGPLEHRILHKDGNTRWIRNALVPQCDPEGHLVAYLGLISDITSRKRAEQFMALQMELTRHLERADVLDGALCRILESLCMRLSWDWGAFWVTGETHEALQWSGLSYARTPEYEAFAKENTGLKFAPGTCLPGRAWACGQPVWIPDLAKEAGFTRGASAARAGLHSGCAFPIHRGEDLIGVVELMSAQPRLPDAL